MRKNRYYKYKYDFAIWSWCSKKVAGFSETALKSVKTRDLGEVGDMLTNLVTDLKAFSADEKEQSGFGNF